MVSRIKDLIVSEYEADVKRKDAELKALEAQINPHFLYNTLETMNSIAYLKGVPEIATITRSLSQLFRYSIDSTKKQVTIADEIFYTTNYINIQKIRYGDTFKVIYRIDAALMEYKVIKLIFQPLIENALIHGLESLKSGGVIVVGAKLVSDQTLVIEVVDNGVGIMPEKLAAIHKSLSGSSDDVSYKITRSIGLANVHFRVRHFYGKKYGLTIANNSEGGVKVTLTIPAIR
jgi:two-component system sensor histidine kinase YesM